MPTPRAATPVPPLPLDLRKEQGQSGLQHTNGFVFEEFLPKLRGMQGAMFFREMQENDPLCWAICFAMEMLVRQVEWTVQPVDQSPAALEAQEFVEGALFDDMTHTFADFMSEVMSMAAHGFSTFEIVYKVRDGEKKVGLRVDRTRSSQYTDRKIGIARLAPRSQLTIWRWDIDSAGEILGFWQVLDGQVDTKGEVKTGMAYIPMEKALLFRTTTKRNNPEGRSVLRGCVVPYLRKKLVEDAEGRAAMRAAGVATLKVPGEIMRPDADEAEQAAFTAYKAMGRALAADRQGFAILPSDRDEKGNALYEFVYTAIANQTTVDMTNIVERMDKRMLSSALADFILLGQQSTGSFALSSDKTEMFSMALGGFLTHIRDELNRRLVAPLCQLNDIPKEVQPKLQHGDIEDVDLESLGSYIQKLAGAGATLFPNPKLQNALLDRADLPVSDTLVGDGEGGLQVDDDIDGLLTRDPASAVALASQQATLAEAKARQRTADNGGVDPEAPEPPADEGSGGSGAKKSAKGAPAK